jgi:hypothetical protein
LPKKKNNLKLDDIFYEHGERIKIMIQSVCVAAGGGERICEGVDEERALITPGEQTVDA